MTKAELDYILGTMLDSHKNVSDLNFTVDKPLQVEAYGELIPVAIRAAGRRLTPFQTEMIALEILNRNRRLTEDLISTGSCDCSYSLGHKARFRVNIFTQRGHYTIILRKLTTDIPTLDQLNMPPVFHNDDEGKDGIGPRHGRNRIGKVHDAGGASERTERNEAHPHRDARRSRRIRSPAEKGNLQPARDGKRLQYLCRGFARRPAPGPKVILVGEMRDRETVEIGSRAAETGHSS